GARAGAPVRARDVDDIRERLHAAGRDQADARLGDELDRDGRIRADLAQVEDELREILDRVDVVVRRRRDQRHAGLRMPEPRDLRRHLVAGQLAALAGLRALRDLDLQLVGERRVLGRDAEAAGGDLLDPRVAVGSEALRILAALAAVRARLEAVEGLRDRLVRLGGEGAVGHAAAREAADDRLGG